MNYKLVKPCKECPYTPKMKGWIGSYDTSTVFHDFVKHDIRMECHLTQNAQTPSHCAGYALYMNKMCKSSKDISMRDFQDRIRLVEQSDEILFSFDGSALFDFHEV